MAIIRNTGAFVGTNEETMVTVAAGGTYNGPEVDVLGDNASVGDIWLYAVITATAASSIDLRVNNRRVSAQEYRKDNYEISVPTINGTKKVPLGRRPAARYMQVDVLNNDSSNAVNVFVGYEVEKLS